MKKAKVIILIIVVVILLAALVGGGVVVSEMFYDRYETLRARLDSIHTDIAALYEADAEDERALPSTLATPEAVEVILGRITEWEAQDPPENVALVLAQSREELLEIEQMLAVRAQVNELLDENGALKPDADLAQTAQDVAQWQLSKPVFYEKLVLVLTEAQQQKEQIDQARQAVEALFADEEHAQIASELTAEDIETVRGKIEGILQPDEKQTLTDLAAQAELLLIEREETANKKPQGGGTGGSSGGGSGGSSGGGAGGSSTPAKTDAQLREEEARVIAKSIADSIGPGTDLERVSQAARIVSQYYFSGVHKESGPYYNTAYGVFIAKESSCAGCTRALGMVLEYMGYSWTHKNAGQWTHQWCVLEMDGQIGWADGQIGWAEYGVYEN